MDGMSIADILRDLRSIKMGKVTRSYVDSCHGTFANAGCLSATDRGKLRDLCKRFSKQMKELHVSRERAKRTNGRRAMGLTLNQVEKLQKNRREEKESSLADFGF